MFANVQSLSEYTSFLEYENVVKDWPACQNDSCSALL